MTQSAKCVRLIGRRGPTRSRRNTWVRERERERADHPIAASAALICGALLMGASGGNCGGVEAPNVITLDSSSGQRWSRSIVVVTADDEDAAYYSQLDADGRCEAEGIAEAGLGQIGNPDLTPAGNVLFRGYVALQSSGFSRAVEEARLGTVELPQSLPTVRPPL